VQQHEFMEQLRNDETDAQSVRNRILGAAFATFAKHGYARASTLEIATLARVSKRELYALFGNKQQMLVTCISERALRMRLPTDWPAPRTRQDLETGLTQIGSVLMQEISDPDVIAVFRLAVCEAERAPEVARALDLYGRQASGKALQQYLESGRSAGLLTGANPGRMVSRFMALLLEGMVMSLALGLVKRPSPMEIRQRSLEAAQAFLTLYPQASAAAGGAPTADQRRKGAGSK